MKSIFYHSSFIYSAIVAYCAWLSVDLLHGWTTDPFAKSGGWAFAGWLLLVCFASRRARASDRASAMMQGGAILLGTLGLLGHLNTIQHIALACAICSLPAAPRVRLILLCSAVAWMPMFGWIGHQAFSLNLNLARVPLVLLAAITLFSILKQAPQIEEDHAQKQGGNA